MIAIAVLAAQYAGTLDVLDTTRIDARVTQTCPPPAQVNPGSPKCFGPTPPSTVQTKVPEQVLIGGDFSTTLGAKFAMTDRRWDYTLAYSPTVTAPDFEVGINPQLLQSASASIAWHDRFTRLLVSETASYGQLYSALLYQLPTAPSQPTTTPAQGTTAQTPVTPQTTPQAAPAAQTIDFGSSSTNAGITTSLSRRVTFAIYGSYAVGGGLTDLARTFLPLQYGPTAGSALSIILSPTDSVSTLVSGQETSTSGACTLLVPNELVVGLQTQESGLLCHTQAWTGQIQETVRHQLNPTMSLFIGAGVGVAAAQTPSSQTLVENELIVLPVASVALNDRFGSQGASNLVLSAQLAPFTDIRTGLPSDRLQVGASLSDRLTPTVLATATAGLLQSVLASDLYPLTAVSGATEARFSVVRDRLDIGLGQQELWQTQSGYGTLFSWIGYVNATARLPTQHF